MKSLTVASALLLRSALAQTDQNTSTIAGIISTSFEFLESHLQEGTKDMGSFGQLPFHFYEPSLEKYSPNQWCVLDDDVPAIEPLVAQGQVR